MCIYIYICDNFPCVRVVVNIVGVELYSRHGKLNLKKTISALWPSRWHSWVWLRAPWKMNAKDAIGTPIGCQRRVLCSILCFGDRFWPFYNFPFLGGRENKFSKFYFLIRGRSNLCIITVCPKEDLPTSQSATQGADPGFAASIDSIDSQRNRSLHPLSLHLS